VEKAKLKTLKRNLKLKIQEKVLLLAF